MERQLFLLADVPDAADPDAPDRDGADTDTDGSGRPPSWRLDDRTREVGREGIAQARAALREATRSAGRAAEAGDGRRAA